jgi:hypothetical protein
MAAGFDPFKKLLGGGGMFKGPQTVSAKQAASHANQPWRTVATETMTSQPYADRLLKIQAAKDLGYNPDWQPDPNAVLGWNNEMRRRNERLSPTGMSAAAGAQKLAGDPSDFEYMTSELDSGWVQDAIASAMPGEPTLPSAPTRGGTTGQPRPGDFKTLIPSPSPEWERRKKLEEIGLLA